LASRLGFFMKRGKFSEELWDEPGHLGNVGKDGRDRKHSDDNKSGNLDHFSFFLWMLSRRENYL